MPKKRVIKNGEYYSFLTLCNESKAIDGGGSNYNIHIWDYSQDNDNQKWQLKLIEGEWYALICKSNNRVMDVDGCNLDDDTNIKCDHIFHFKANQQFRFIKCDSEFFDSSILSKVNFTCTIRQGGCSGNNMHPNLAIDAATEDNGKIQLWEHVNNAKNQLWDFIGVGPDIYYIRSCSKDLRCPFICNTTANQVIYKSFDGKMGNDYKWKFIKQGQILNKDLYLIQNVQTNNYLDSGPHSNHKCGGDIYTNVRCGVEQIFMLTESNEINKNSNNNSNNKNEIILQRNFNVPAIKKSGCLFLACCYVGGLTTYDQCLSAYYWASKEGKIRGNDCYVNMNSNTLALQISKHFRTSFKEGCRFSKNSHHFWVERNGIEIYNSAGI